MFKINILRATGALFCCFFLFVTGGFAQGMSGDSVFCLEVRGQLDFPKNASKSYKVKLYWNNRVVDSHAVKNNKPFVFHLKRDEVYGLQITKRGYYTRLITIDTRISEADTNIYLFDFETTLIKKNSKSKKLDKDALDYPIAIVAYDDKMIGFYYDEEYTGEIKRNIYGKMIKSRYSLRKM